MPNECGEENHTTAVVTTENKTNRGWLETISLGWLSSKHALSSTATTAVTKSAEGIDVAVSSSSVCTEQQETSDHPQSGWDRVKAIYTDGASDQLEDVHMESDVTLKMTRFAFMAGAMVGGLSGYAATKERYEMYSTGRTYLSRRDALRRKWDYGIVMFVRNGFRTGLRSAALVGSVVLLTTHCALWREHFSAWYFPVVSGANAFLLHRASVGSVLAFPLGLLGSMKAVGLGISSGLSLSAVVVLYAMHMDKSVNEAYNIFKKDYEKGLKDEKLYESQLQTFMKEHNIPWRHEAIKRMRLEEERRLLEEPEG
ncbi:unnamed protein product [Anisakis simplex]|uniref:Complex I assembly factor TIMMDC1, mitochondrial n=1 Tax=Anisakis simplex TaxID=6269 RepID=A0A0M3JZD4_ANISI|nr:unnamed protein product [Anisakis simplex]